MNRGWKRIGMVLSVVWITSAYVYAWNTRMDLDKKFAVSVALACEAAHGDDDNRCIRGAEDYVEKMMPEERTGAAVVALVPVPLAWLSVYLTIWIVGWIERDFRPDLSTRVCKFRQQK